MARDISVRDWAREKGCRLRIACNGMGSIFRPNNEHWKWLHVEIMKGALSGVPGYLCARLGMRKWLPSHNRAKSHG